jgi:hypothetical protein
MPSLCEGANCFKGGTGAKIAAFVSKTAPFRAVPPPDASRRFPPTGCDQRVLISRRPGSRAFGLCGPQVLPVSVDRDVLPVFCGSEVLPVFCGSWGRWSGLWGLRSFPFLRVVKSFPCSVDRVGLPVFCGSGDRCRGLRVVRFLPFTQAARSVACSVDRVVVAVVCGS